MPQPGLERCDHGPAAGVCTDPGNGDLGRRVQDDDLRGAEFTEPLQGERGHAEAVWLLGDSVCVDNNIRPGAEFPHPLEQDRVERFDILRRDNLR